MINQEVKIDQEIEAENEDTGKERTLLQNHDQDLIQEKGNIGKGHIQGIIEENIITEIQSQVPETDVIKVKETIKEEKKENSHSILVRSTKARSLKHKTLGSLC